MSQYKDHSGFAKSLTNEGFRGLFKSHFELTNRAIRLAHLYVKSGHEISLSKILEEVRANPGDDYIETLEALEHESA